MTDYAAIIEREFRKTLEISHTVPVIVDMSEDEVIKVLYDGAMYVCNCDSDDTFEFNTTDDNISFPIPADYLE